MKCIPEQQGRSSVTDAGPCVLLRVYTGASAAGAGGRAEQPQLPDIILLKQPPQKEDSENCTSLPLQS